MSLRIYNTLHRRLEAFQPIEPGHVRMYVCGMTIYDLIHFRWESEYRQRKSIRLGVL